MNRVLLLLLYWIPAFAASGQTARELSGTVRDTLGNAVPGATVTLIRLKDQAGLLFTTANASGTYILQLLPEYLKDSLAVKVTAAGFLKNQQHTGPHTAVIDFTMQPAEASLLPNVTVSNQAALVQKGDTLSYDAAHFTEKSDRRLGDIIKKLPGVEMDESGVIKYKGKMINKFYIEGDNLLDDRYTIATDNINVADVDKVQIIEHNQDVKMLNGIVPSDRAGVNIILKNRSKLKLINNAELTGALPKAYAAEGKSMAFKPKFKAINEIKLNDIGVTYTRESGISGLQTPGAIDAARALFNNSKMVNINNLYKLNPHTGIKLNGFYIKDHQQTSNMFRTRYYLPGRDSVAYTEQNQNQLETGALYLDLNYTVNSPKAYFNTTGALNHSRNTGNMITRTPNRIAEASQYTTTDFSHAISGYLMIRKKHLLSYRNAFNYTENPQQAQFEPGALPDLLNNRLSYLQTLQYRRLQYFNNGTVLGYNKVLANWTLGFNAGINLQQHQLDSRVALLQNDSSHTVPPGFGNALYWKKNELFAGASLTYNGDRIHLTLSAPAKWQHYQYTNDSLTANKDRGSRFTHEPSVNWEYRVGREHSLFLDYRLDYKTAGIQQVYGGPIISGYRNFASYETPFLMSRNHNIRAGFGYKRVIKLLFADFDVQYAATKNFFMYSTLIRDNLTVVKALPIINNSETGGTSIRVGKYIFSLNTTLVLSGALNTSKSQQLQNEQLFDTRSLTKSAGISITPTVLKWLKLDLSSSYLQYHTWSGQANFQLQQLRQWKQQSGVTIYPSKGLSFNFTNQYYHFVQKGNPVTSSLFMDVYAQYNFDKTKLLLRLSCTNIAGTAYFETLRISDNVVYTASYALRPRMLRLWAAFDF
ncbi:carboxypeptidase-like regulatory domain-containing protein [Niabella drilacis]|uniref:Outer membrane receptor proteins, mostly Fe transport n=1 Tax=Niabella drilacis (strain DSM 25811 / CCM 8410 / CCUG 62505 / LMG 26954 / E90) TaxID=1285928 RepID=A0A1G6SBH9_NIADE|nr:carboxypeptidase-like regulatory domain-containing protein [Niabella drilacis]SDD14248.1 Outer membrane receptor proteins, mostly Fe transport [Niabella drilacis]